MLIMYFNPKVTMAAAAITEALLCPVCYEHLDDPKILTVCGHTVCKMCLDGIFCSRPSQQLTCPICRQDTPIPEGDVSKLPTNVTLKGMVDDLKSATHSDLQNRVQMKISKIIEHAEFINLQKEQVKEAISVCRCEIEKAHDEAVVKLVERKGALLKVCDDHESALIEKLDQLAEKDAEMVSSLTNARELMVDCVNASFTEDDIGVEGTDAVRDRLKDLLKVEDPDFPAAIAITKHGEKLHFNKKQLDCDLGEVGIVEWKLKSDVALFKKGYMNCVSATPDNKMALGSSADGGIVIYSADGKLLQRVLMNKEIRRVAFLSDGQCVVRDTNKGITLYTTKWKARDVKFETLSFDEGGSGGLAVDSNDHIYVGYRKAKKIMIFKSAGGKAFREIPSAGYEPCQFMVIDPSRMIVLVTQIQHVIVVMDERGRGLHKVAKDNGTNLYPAVCKDGTILVACVNEMNDRVTIERFTCKMHYVETIITDHVIDKPGMPWYYLREFRSGALALCSPDKMYIFKKSISSPER